jgi:hypothetical protein
LITHDQLDALFEIHQASERSGFLGPLFQGHRGPQTIFQFDKNDICLVIAPEDIQGPNAQRLHARVAAELVVRDLVAPLQERQVQSIVTHEQTCELINEYGGAVYIANVQAKVDRDIDTIARQQPFLCPGRRPP